MKRYKVLIIDSYEPATLLVRTILNKLGANDKKMSFIHNYEDAGVALERLKESKEPVFVIADSRVFSASGYRCTSPLLRKAREYGFKVVIHHGTQDIRNIAEGKGLAELVNQGMHHVRKRVEHLSHPGIFHQEVLAPALAEPDRKI